MLFEEDFNTPQELAVLKIACENSLKAYIKVMHYYLTGSHFTFKPFHNEVIQALEDRAFYKTTKNLILNLPVGSGKSTIVEYYLSWSYARNKNLCFLYTSYSDKLIQKFSGEIKDIMSSKEYQSLWNYEFKKDRKSKANWSIEGSVGRAGLTAGSIGGTITGLDAGNPAVQGFCGAMICLPYNQKIATEKGFVKIGDIVENKLDLLVYSYNLETKEIELKPIQNYVKNPYKPIVEVSYKGIKFKCTCDHKVYTTNRGYVEAINLLPSDVLISNSFNLMDTNVKSFSNIFSSVIPITNKTKFFIGKLAKGSRIVISKALGFISPIITPLNTNNRSSVNVKILGNYSDWSFIASNYPSNFWSEFSPWAIYSKWKSSVLNSVLHIIRLSAISKVFKSIVSWVAVKVSTLNAFGLLAHKPPKNASMNSNTFTNSIFSKCKIKMPASMFLSFNNFSSTFASNFTKIGNTIKPFIFGDRFKNFFCHNVNSTYCITVWGNHNIFAGESQQAILVSNCDDPMKAGDEIYDTKRDLVKEHYDKKLTTRLRRNDVPTIVIMQRLHEDDLTGYLKSFKGWEEYFDCITVQALENEKSFWEEKITTAQLIKEREEKPFVFYPQRQQDPTADFNSSFKGLWFMQDDELNLIENGNGHIDKGFDGDDGTAFTIIKQKNGLYYVLGKLWKGAHIDDCLPEIKALKDRFLCGGIMSENNDDKGYTAKNNSYIGSYHEKQNKAEKIMFYLYPDWKNIRFHPETDVEYIKQIQYYSTKSTHDDAADSLASAIKYCCNLTKINGMRPF